MVFKYVSCDLWVIQLAPEWHLGGLARLARSSQLLHPHQKLTVRCLPGPRPTPCLQQMWFTGQGSLLKQLSTNGRSLRCCWVPGTLCDGNSGHPLWSSSLAHLQGHPSKCETGICSAPLLFFWMPLLSSWLSSPSLGHGMVPSQTFLDWVAWVGSSSSSMLTLDDITGNAYWCLLESPYKWLSYLIHNHFTYIHTHIQHTYTYTIHTITHTYIHSNTTYILIHSAAILTYNKYTHTTHTLMHNAHIFTSPTNIHSHTLKYTHTLTRII